MTVGEESPSKASWSAHSTCVEPDHRELILSVGTVLHRRVRDNELVEAKITPPLFMEDTHTEPEPPEEYDVVMPLLHLQTLGLPTLFALSKLPPPPPQPRTYPVPSPDELQPSWRTSGRRRTLRRRCSSSPSFMLTASRRARRVLLHARS